MKFALAAILLATPLARAQSPASPACASPALAVFDVATVKPSDRPSGSSRISGRPDTLFAAGTVLRMIEYAYNLHDFQVTGTSPGWFNTATWEATAKVDQPPADYDSLSNEARDLIQRQRMQAVLAQRFTLKCHFETRELPVYNIVLAKGGPKLTPTPADAKKKNSLNTEGRNRANRMDANGIAIESLASALVWPLGRTVIDKTGLTGLYDFTLIYTSDPTANSPASADADNAGPTIFTALEEQLGLKLEPAKGPVPVLVIDSIDRPSEN